MPINESNYNFHLWTSKTLPIKNLSELLRDLLTEGNLECSEDGIKLLSVDPTRTVLVHLKLFGNKFEEYKCDGNMVIGLNLEDFFKIIKNMENVDTLRLFVDKDDVNSIGIERFNKEENITNTIYLSLMDIPLYERSIPPAKFDSVIVMSSSRFQRICREIFQFSEKIEITSVGNQLSFKGYNTTVKQEIVVKPANSGMKFESNENPDQIVQGVFDLKHLVQFSKCANLSEKIRIHFKNNFPLVIQSDVSDIGIIKLCLAPQSEE
jgi:proliferating cell nuclear antigen